MFKKLISLILILSILSCYSKNIIKNNSPKLNMQIGSISLEDHQVKTVNYLLEHPEQKGLLIAHYLGTGKTFTALAYSESISDKDIIIIAPEFLRANWLSHMNLMGLRNKSRYKFLSFQEAKNTVFDKLGNSIVIIDEIHRLVDLIKHSSLEERQNYTKFYKTMRNAWKIIALSGTPIFSDVSDLAYSINLVSGEDLLPYNERIFLDKYTKINKVRSFWRGHMSESHLLIFGLPFVVAAIPLAFITPAVGVVSGVYFGGLAAGHLSLPLINSALALNQYPLRSFEASKLKDITNRYVSYFDFSGQEKSDTNLYPSKTIHENTIKYNEKQIEFFLEFADNALDNNQLKLLTRESSYALNGDLQIESSSLQQHIASIAESGREIGNLSLGAEVPKFAAVFDTFKNKSHGIVIYSSYYENGILLFADYLKSKNLEGQFKILHPEQSVEQQMNIVSDYNRGETRILLLHPAFTEGISLEGTQALHILEPVASQALFEQIIGRVIRLNSHTKLAKEMQHVDVYSWECTLSGLDAFLAKNNNWARRFNELNSIASFGVGQAEIDNNFLRKKLSPDQFSNQKRNMIKNAMANLKELLGMHSIERGN